MKTAAIYARVSSDKQREENTIASQTSALIAFAREQNCDVPAEWVIEDDGYSGASLLRPGLERLRDLAAEGLIQAVLIYAPDRLSRRYAHQILLIEEFARAGVEVLFIRSRRGTTPEDELLLQFQGMIAEYERAQILERSRRGKRHRARQGQVSVLAGAPYGYRYRRKTDHSAAYYEIDEEQARVVRWAYDLYTVQNSSIGAIARLFNERHIPTAKRTGRWERSTIWAMLRNPAYIGKACFGKTRAAPRQRITRPLRLRGGVATRDSAGHELPRAEWIEIPVPPIIGEDTFALAAERLQSNKKHAPRRTVTPSVVQGLVSCAKCGYGLYRTFDEIHRPDHLLLSLPRLGRLAPARRAGLRLSPDASGFAGRSGVERDRALARRPESHSGRARSPARGRAERPIRPGDGKKRCVAISRVAERASSAYSRPTKKASSPSRSCAAACRTCGDANRLASRNCKRSKTNRRSAKSACASPNPSRIFWRACDRRPKPSMLASVNACCVFSSRKSSSQTTRSSSATPSPCPPTLRAENPSTPTEAPAKPSTARKLPFAYRAS